MKKLKDMTQLEIIDWIKSGKLKSEKYNSYIKYLNGMHGEDKK